MTGGSTRRAAGRRASSPACAAAGEPAGRRPTARRCRSIPASGWSTTCATGCSSICRRSACTITSPPAPATRSTASTSTPTAIENLVMSGIFPLATSVITLVRDVRRSCCRLDVTLALLSLAVVPFLYLCLRYYTSTLVERGGAGQGARVEAASSGSTRSSARCGWSRASRASRTSCSATRAPATKTMSARIAITWQQSLFAVVVSTITILGTALVLDRRRHARAATASMTVGELTVVIAYLGAVYGPLSAIAHTTGQLQGAIAGARRVRAMFALTARDRRRAGRDRRRPTSAATSGSSDVGFAYPDGTRGAARHQLRGAAGRDGRAGRPDRRRQDDAGQPDPALLRRRPPAAC